MGHPQKVNPSCSLPQTWTTNQAKKHLSSFLSSLHMRSTPCRKWRRAKTTASPTGSKYEKQSHVCGHAIPPQEGQCSCPLPIPTGLTCNWPLPPSAAHTHPVLEKYLSKPLFETLLKSSISDLSFTLPPPQKAPVCYFYDDFSNSVPASPFPLLEPKFIFHPLGEISMPPPVCPIANPPPPPSCSQPQCPSMLKTVLFTNLYVFIQTVFLLEIINIFFSHWLTVTLRSRRRRRETCSTTTTQRGTRREIMKKKSRHLSNFPNFFANQIERSWERQKYLTVSINISCKLFSQSLFVYNRLPWWAKTLWASWRERTREAIKMLKN